MTLIRKPKVVASERETTSTHFPNETEKKPVDSDQGVTNNYEPDTLVDPEDTSSGSTHFNNEEEYSEKSNRMNGGKTVAASKPKAPKHPGAVPLAKEKGPHHPAKTKAGVAENDPTGEADPDFVAGPDADGDFPAGGPDSGVMAAQRIKADSEEETGQEPTTNMPNDEDPTAGYLTVSNELEGEDVGAPLANQVGLEPDAGATEQQPLEVPDGSDQAVVSEFDDDEDLGEVAPEGDENLIDDEAIEEAAGPGPEEMSILDVDGTDDGEGDDVVFATVGTVVRAMKANRIIASMSKKVAVKAGHEDMYLSEQFQDVTYVEMAKHGLRAGLQKMGFALETINVGRAEVLNKRVEAKAAKVTAAVRRQSADSLAAMDQCLAIAAVGVNVGYFKDTQNELRAHLENELDAIGVRGAKKMLAQAFAKHGIAFAKQILTTAAQLSQLSVEARNHHVKALDMVGDEGGDMGDENLFGDQAAPDFQSQFAAPEEGDEFIDDMEAEGPAPETVHAALSRPATRVQREVSARATGYSVTAAAILSGKAPFLYNR
jgi:hypothetical protein